MKTQSRESLKSLKKGKPLSFAKKLNKAFNEAPKGQVGQTDSGKPVLGSDAEGYSKDFTSEDHRDAEKIHKDKDAGYQQKQRSFMLGKKKSFDHRLLAVFSNQQAKHADNAKYHAEQAEEVSDAAEKAKAAKLNPPQEEAPVQKAEKVCMDQKELVEEHENLVNVLETPDKKDDAKEAKKQKKELKAYKKIRKSFSDRVEDLQKGGPGSGKQGHTTPLDQQKASNEVSSNVNRRPYPGEDTKPEAPQPKANAPTHPNDVHPNKALPGSQLFNHMGKLYGEEWENKGLHNHVEYNAKKDTLTPKDGSAIGEKAIAAAKSHKTLTDKLDAWGGAHLKEHIQYSPDDHAIAIKPEARADIRGVIERSNASKASDKPTDKGS